jgi:hypothetical protein
MPLGHARDLADSENADDIADSLEARFHPMDDPSVPAVIEVVSEAMQVYSYAPASEPQITNPAEVQSAIRCLKVGKAAGPDGIPNKVFKHLPLRVVSLQVVKEFLRTQYAPASSKYTLAFSILKPGKDTALPSSY